MFDKSTQESILHTDWYVSIPALSWNSAKTVVLVTILLTVTTLFVDRNYYLCTCLTHFICQLIQASYFEATNNYIKKQLAIMSDVTQ